MITRLAWLKPEPKRSHVCRRVARGIGVLSYHFLCHLLASRSPALVEEEFPWGHPHMGGIRTAPQVLSIGGISQRRAEWFCRWCKETAKAETVNTSSFEEGLGRTTYVAGALEYERALLSPLL